MYCDVLEIISLIEIMERFKARELAEIIEDLYKLQQNFMMGRVTANEGSLNADDWAWIKESLTQALQITSVLGLDNATQKIHNSLRYFEEEKSHIIQAAAQTEIRNIREAIQDGLRNYQFIKIAKGREIYIEQSLLGNLVQVRFPSAKPDIFEAKACLMAGCDTAAVFHLMRVIEWGLRAFCQMVGLDELLVNKKAIPPKYIPVEFAQWEQILNQLPEKIEVLVNGLPKGTERQESQQFYYICLQEVTALREAWRNHVMHTRADYGPSDSNQVLSHVRLFMERLASKTGELGYESKT